MATTQDQITRLQNARNKIRAKAVELGIGTNTDKLDTLADGIDGIVNRGAVSATVKEGDTYSIPAGYHNGSGTVSGVGGGGNYTLQSKSVTPTKKQQSVTPDSGYYGLSDVTVAPIPDAYQDVTSVTAAAGDVLANKVFVTKDGSVTAGTMANNGAVNATIDGLTTTQYTIPAGYHSGANSDDLATLIAAIEAGGGGGGNTEVEDALVSGTITEYTNSRVTIIRNYAFASCSSLTSINFPVVTSIGYYAFQYCPSLTSVNFPVATYIGGSAFYGCYSLTSINFPVATYIGGNAFVDCRSLTSANFPAVTSIGSSAFYNCSSLTSVNFPVVTSMGNYAFGRCSSLTTLILGASSVCRLSNSNAFQGTPIASGTGYVYVPASLIASYQAATNWTYYSSRFSAIEDMGV